MITLKTARTGKSILIDDEDIAHVMKFNRSYSVTTHGYAAVIDFIGVIDGKYKYQKHYLHRLIMNAPKHLQVDHINGDKLDNRKSNLRLCKNKSNARNKKNSKGEYKGVYYSNQNKKWIAQITKNYKVSYLGCFDTPEKAALAYNRAAKRLHGK